MLHRIATRAAGALAAAALAAGCAAPGSQTAREWLDEASGVTVASAFAPATFARTEAQYSLAERDYAYIAPVETNRRGSREYYLWVGIGTTIDRGFLAPTQETPNRLYVPIRGEWMALDLRPWREREPSLETVVYRTRVELSSELAARVTLHQLALLETEPPDRIALAQGEGSLREYARWDAGVWPTVGGDRERRSVRGTRRR